ncbi:MAG: glycosyl hydrolase 115 family protein, partial [Muribaculaceae bacterium]|nr:glycosyl hydrolase 115 family protein [Muribaculaceae bacterium]
MKHNIKSTIRNLATAVLVATTIPQAKALDNPSALGAVGAGDSFSIFSPSHNNGAPLPIYLDGNELKGIMIAAQNLSDDFRKVCGHAAELVTEPKGDRMIIVGSITSPIIKKLMNESKIDRRQIEGKNEKYIMSTVIAPLNGVDEALVIAGSDKRGTIYGIYELSELIGVSPWYDWADVPVEHLDSFAIRRGTYTAGEPAVKYRGIFLNDEAPCLTSWVKNTYGTNYGDHRFYGRVFELLLRLRGNFLWPAMWAWAFYADDPENGRLADEMGVIIGTSHHEPMARNHQEWARNRHKNGAWNYNSNQKTIDEFFTEGIRRMKGTEDVVTIGMRG